MGRGSWSTPGPGIEEWIATVGVNDWYGDLDAHFIVRPNTSGARRTGTVTIGEVVSKVIQEGT